MGWFGVSENLGAMVGRLLGESIAAHHDEEVAAAFVAGWKSSTERFNAEWMDPDYHPELPGLLLDAYLEWRGLL